VGTNVCGGAPAGLYKVDGVGTAPARRTDRKAAPLPHTALHLSGLYRLRSVLEEGEEMK